MIFTNNIIRQTFPEKTIIRMVGKSSKDDCSRIPSEGHPSPSLNNHGDASSRRLKLGQHGQCMEVEMRKFMIFLSIFSCRLISKYFREDYFNFGGTVKAYFFNKPRQKLSFP